MSVPEPKAGILSPTPLPSHERAASAFKRVCASRAYTQALSNNLNPTDMWRTFLTVQASADMHPHLQTWAVVCWQKAGCRRTALEGGAYRKLQRGVVMRGRIFVELCCRVSRCRQHQHKSAGVLLHWAVGWESDWMQRDVNGLHQ